jgi:hypothetical protein
MPALTVFNGSDRLNVPLRAGRIWALRLRLVIIVPLAACLSAAVPALAAKSSTARFLVSVRATVTKDWDYTMTRTSAGCRARIDGKGTRTITFRSRDVSVVTARWAGGRSRVRFSGSVGSLGGSIRQTGKKTTKQSGSAGCEQGTRHAVCTPVSRTFAGQRAQLVSGRLHKLGFRRLRGFVPDAFFGDCPGEPASVRSIGSGLSLADATLDERDLFNRSVGGLTLQGSADSTTTLLNRSATVTEHVRFTVTLRRLGS